MSIQAVIFDRDGVLANFDEKKAKNYFESHLGLNTEDILSHWLNWGKIRGYPRSLDEEEIFFRDFWEYLSVQCDISPKFKAELMELNYTNFMFAYPEARDVLLQLHKKVKIGVLSNFSLASLEASLSTLNLMDLIDAASSAIVIGFSKPDPNAYLNIINRLNVKPQECLFFDDELPNIKGAKNLGMHAYFIDRNLKEHKISENILCDLSPIPHLLKTLNKG